MFVTVFRESTEQELTWIIHQLLHFSTVYPYNGRQLPCPQLMVCPQMNCGRVSTGNLMAELSQKTVCFSDKSPDWIHRKSFGDFPKSS
jgi:hypothetical protein